MQTRQIQESQQADSELSLVEFMQCSPLFDSEDINFVRDDSPVREALTPWEAPAKTE